MQDYFSHLIGDEEVSTDVKQIFPKLYRALITLFTA